MTTTQKLSELITGNDYLSAYRSRMEVNNDYFLEVAKELTALGYNVYAPTHGLISFLYVEGSGKQITFGFDDVPYRWYISCQINYKLGRGSSRRIKEIFDYNTPFTSSEIVENMQPIVPTLGSSINHLQLLA
jgi:hypothetical protein